MVQTNVTANPKHNAYVSTDTLAIQAKIVYPCAIQNRTKFMMLSIKDAFAWRGTFWELIKLHVWVWHRHAWPQIMCIMILWRILVFVMQDMYWMWLMVGVMLRWKSVMKRYILCWICRTISANVQVVTGWVKMDRRAFLWLSCVWEIQTLSSTTSH